MLRAWEVAVLLDCPVMLTSDTVNYPRGAVRGVTPKAQEVTVVCSGLVSFADPQDYQAAVKPAQVELVVTARGEFGAALTGTKLPQLRLQRGRERLPRVANAMVEADRCALFSSPPLISHQRITAVGLSLSVKSLPRLQAQRITFGPRVPVIGRRFQ